MFKKFASVTLYVNSQDEAKAFWLDKAGFTLNIDAAMDDKGNRWVEVGVPGDGASLVLYSKPLAHAQMPDSTLSTPDIIFDSDDPQATHDLLKSKGVEVTDVKTEFFGTWFNFKDQDGNLFIVIKDAIM